MKQCVKKQKTKINTRALCMAIVVMIFIFIHSTHAEKREQTNFEQAFTIRGRTHVRMSLLPNAQIDTKAPALFTLPQQLDGTFAPYAEIAAGNFSSTQLFNLVGAQWDESSAADITSVTVQVRTRADQEDEWSAWQELERLRDTPDGKSPSAGTAQTEPLIVNASTEGEVRIILTSADPKIAPQITNLTITVIGTEMEDNSSTVRAALIDANAGFHIATRAEWGADESLRYNTQGEDQWPEAHGQVRAFVIHHTGGSNGGSDPAATVRAIQKYHGKTLSWGDIGYNYLIAPNGMVFEGRRGGEGAIGGHVYNDTRKIGYNTGTIGIALLGSFEGRDAMTAAARESLASLIAALSFEHEIVPTGETRLKDLVIPTVVSHRDIDATICPGSGITSELLQVRQLAHQKLEARGGLASITRRATLVQQSDTSLLIKPGQSKTVWVQYRNDGNTSWKNYLDAPVQLADAGVKSRLAALPTPSVTAALVDASTVRMAQVADDEIKPIETPNPAPVNALTFAQPNVAPGEVVTIPVVISVGPNEFGTLERDYVLVWGALGYFPGSEFHVTVETTEIDWAAKVEEITIPASTMAGAVNHAQVTVRNKGLRTWMKGSVFMILTDAAGAPSKWHGKDWPLAIGKIMFNESVIAPNEVATFPVTITATEPGTYESRVSFRYLPDNGVTPSETLIDVLRLPEMKGVTGSSLTEVLPSAFAEFVKPYFPPKLRPGQAVTIRINVKNTGDKTWKGGKATTLTETTADGKASAFYDKADWINEDTPAFLWQTSLMPGKVGTLTWRLRAPKEKGTYTEKLTLFSSEGLTLINGKSDYTFTIKVE